MLDKIVKRKKRKKIKLTDSIVTDGDCTGHLKIEILSAEWNGLNNMLQFCPKM